MQKLKHRFQSFELIFSQLYRSLISFFKILLLSKKKVEFPDKQHENCLLLMSGPSLKKELSENFDKLAGYDTVVVNHFADSDQYEKIRPTHYFFLDTAFLLNNIEEGKILTTINNILNKTTWKMNVFLPHFYRKNYFAQRIAENPNLNIVTYNSIIIGGFPGFVNWLLRKRLGILKSYNVLGAAITSMVQMQYKNVFIFGADHSWLQDMKVTDDNRLVIEQKHFYSQPGKVITTPICKSSVSNEPLSIGDYLSFLSVTFKVYYFLEEFSGKMGVRIFNVTKGSYIDAFERKNPFIYESSNSDPYAQGNSERK